MQMSGIIDGTSPIEISVESELVVLKQNSEAGPQTLTLQLGQVEKLINWFDGYVEMTRESLAEE
jgi:hypothetical protein